ncbi:MAG: C25 family cysteine peptidase, partial [Candidatus Thermoplasmatota archaeon]
MLKIFKKNVCLAVALSLLIILSALWTNAFVQGFREETTIMVVKFVFVKPEVKEKDSSTEITMEGLSSYGEEGKPVLPFKNVKLLIPYSKTVREVRVAVGSKETITFKQPIEHGQAPIPFIDGGKLDYTPQNETLYNSSEPYPNELFSEYTIQYLRGYKLLIFNLYPVQYIPSLEMIFWYKSMRAEVVLDSSANKDKSPVMGIRGIECDREIVMSAVDNKEVIETYPQKTSSLNGTSYRYVIITNEVLKNSKEQYNWQALTAYKESKGITTNIVTVEEIYKNYDGKRPDGKTDNQTKIRNFIIDAYTNWKTEYILLGGDGDVKDVGGESGNNIIPVRHFYSRFRVDHPIPADMYYSNLDGTFDFDKDGYYGEPADGIDGGEVDLYSEVFIGRAPVDSEKELSNFVRKTLEYENASDDYLKSVWMVGELLWPGTYGGDYKDEIRYGSSAHGYTTVGFPEQFNIQTLYDRDGRWDKEKLISIINSNVHLINHLGHANLNYVMKMVNQDVDRLTNDKYFFAYSQGCLPGAFDNWNTHTGKYTKEDSIAEHLTTNSTGAFAVIMNTRYGWGKRGSTDGPSQRYDRQFWDAIFGEKIDKLGKANQDSKEDNIGYLLAGDGVMRWCYYEITLFGDPELSLKSCFEPKISSISPSTGYVTAKVTITGKNFGKLDSSSSVIFNGTKAKNIIFWSDTEIKVEVPKGALSGTVVVTTSSGASKSDTIFTVIKVVGQELLTDINLNGTVDNDDFCILANDFMKPKPTNIRSDINGDGMVDKIDSDLLVSDFGKSATLITDLNRDYKVDIYDLALVSGVLGKNPSVRPEADVNRDGKIDIADLNRVNEDFGRSAYMISHYLKYTDINRDEVVDYKDLLIVAKAFNSSSTIDPRADLNRDNFVNLSDANLTMRDMEIERRNETYAEYSIADINRDGQVNGLDFSILAMDYGKSRPQNPRSDINGDGIVNWPDYSLLIKYYRKIATLITDINEDYKVDIYD